MEDLFDVSNQVEDDDNESENEISEEETSLNLNQAHGIQEAYNAVSRRSRVQLLTYSARKPRYTPLSRNGVSGLMRDCLYTHRTNEAMDVLRILISERRMPADLIFRSSIILFGIAIKKSDEYDRKSALLNDFRRLLEMCSSKDMRIPKHELILEILVFLLQHNLVVQATNLRDNYKKSLTDSRCTTIYAIDGACLGYFYYVDYINWRQAVDEDPYVATPKKSQAIKLMQNLQQIILGQPNINGVQDIFLYTIFEICKFYGLFEEEIGFFETVAGKQIGYLFASYTYYKALKCIPKFNQDEDKLRSCRASVIAISPSEPLVLEPTDLTGPNSKIEYLKRVMTFLDYRDNKMNLEAWSILVKMVQMLNSDCETKVKEVKRVYLENYGEYWKKYHFNCRNIDTVHRHAKDVLKTKLQFVRLLNVAKEFESQATAYLSGDEPMKLESNSTGHAFNDSTLESIRKKLFEEM
ncbi:hypothetical protein HDE_12337 [Halotydeus destructor]|nr:hypothetical protein HDE_12337 [Halotydeus destructor]